MVSYVGSFLVLLAFVGLAMALLAKTVRYRPGVPAPGGLSARPGDRREGPGLVLLIPFIDRAVRVDLRETFFDFRRRARLPATTRTC